MLFRSVNICCIDLVNVGPVRQSNLATFLLESLSLSSGRPARRASASAAAIGLGSLMSTRVEKRMAPTIAASPFNRLGSARFRYRALPWRCRAFRGKEGSNLLSEGKNGGLARFFRRTEGTARLENPGPVGSFLSEILDFRSSVRRNPSPQLTERSMQGPHSYPQIGDSRGFDR